jgi:hypothetical protein
MEKGLVQGNEVPIEYEDLVAPHVESFDYFLGDGMQSMVVLMPPMEVGAPHTYDRLWQRMLGSRIVVSAIHLTR